MNVYSRLDASFWCENKEYKLHPIGIDDCIDCVEVITAFRHPDIKRGCIGNLILYADKGIDWDGGDAPTQEDCICEVLLRSVTVWSADEGESVYWKYIFLKD